MPSSCHHLLVYLTVDCFSSARSWAEASISHLHHFLYAKAGGRYCYHHSARQVYHSHIYRNCSHLGLKSFHQGMYRNPVRHTPHHRQRPHFTSYTVLFLDDFSLILLPQKLGHVVETAFCYSGSDWEVFCNVELQGFFSIY